MSIALQTPISIEEMPQLRNDLKIIKFWSFLLSHNWRRYVAIGYNLLIIGTEYSNIYEGNKSVDSLIRSMYMIALMSNAVLRAGILCWRRSIFENFMEKFRLLYVELIELKDIVINEMLQKTNQLTIRLSKLNLITGFMAVCGFLFYPIFMSARILPFEIYIPGIDKTASPNYEILFVMQFFLSLTGYSMYIPYTNLFVAYILFAILMARVLQHNLRSLDNLPKDRVQSELIRCIKYQLKFISFVGSINKLSTYLHLVEFLYNGAMLCVMLFLFLIVETVGQQVIIVIFILMIFGQSVVLYYCANELYVQSIGIAVAAYDCNWFDFDVETQKYMRLFIQRAQIPCSVSVGNIFPMNLDMLQALLNVTYRYFTVLKRFYG